MILPSRRALLLLAGASVLFVFGTGIGFAADVAVVALVLIDGFRARRRGVAVVRPNPGRVGLHGTLTLRLEFENPHEEPLLFRITQDLPEALERDGEHTFSFEIPPRRAAELEEVVTAVERGRWRLGPVRIRMAGPLGLAWHERSEDPAGVAVVQPELTDLRRYNLLAMQNRLREMGVRTIRHRGEGRSFESLREYIRGDDPRHIDWKASARHTSMMVRQYEIERSQNVLIAIDAGRLMTEDIGGTSRLDHALSAALLLAYVAQVHRDRVGVFVFADEIQAYLPPSRVPLQKITEILTDVTPRVAEPHYPIAFRYLGQNLKRRSLVVLFTDVIDALASRAFLAHLTPQARRHLPLVVALRNPEIEEVATAPRYEEQGVYERAAAEELLDWRAHALAAARRTGAIVADAKPTDASPSVVNAYLDVKRRGLL